MKFLLKHAYRHTQTTWFAMDSAKYKSIDYHYTRKLNFLPASISRFDPIPARVSQ